ncbi:VOC family protein [Palleronia sp. KMU-117]|uniref:VOC family protein n=1 Tax=Palleronia sp. KMU-117 TaxID=3434108 RepID=UPI003D764CEC
MQPIPYLFFTDRCAEAMRFYADVFGSPEPEIMPFSAMPEDERTKMPGMPDDAVMHASVRVGDGWLFASDDPSGSTPPMAGASVNVSLPNADEARRVFARLADGGEVRMPLEATFWTPAFGALTDRFGTRWMIMADSPPPA